MADKITLSDIELTEALRERLEEVYEMHLKINQEQNSRLAAMGETVGSAEQELATINARNKALIDTNILLETGLDKLERKVVKATKHLDILKDSNDATQEEVDKQQKLRDLYQHIVTIKRNDPRTLKQIKEQIESEKALNDQLETRVNLSRDYAKGLLEIVGLGESWKNTTTGAVVGLLQQEGGLRRTAKAMKDRLKITNLAGNAMTKVVETTVALAVEQDQAIGSFKKATGAGDQYNDVIIDSQLELRSLGVSTADTADATRALVTQLSNFSAKSEEAKKSLIGTVSVLNKFGINADQSTKSLSLLTKGLGQSDKQASASMRQFFATADAIGQTPKVIFEQFSQAAPQLAAHGGKMIKVFQGMAAAAKVTEASMSTLMQLAGQFDQFESGAQAVGKLNAMLGGPYLNTVDMLNSSEEERIRHILRAMELSGKQFKDLGKYEQIAIANSLGIKDMAEANRILGTSTAAYDQMQRKAKAASIGQKEFEKAAKDAQGVFEKWRIVMQNFAVSIRPLTDLLGKLADAILVLQGKSDAFGWTLLVVSGLLLLFKGRIGGAASALATKLTPAFLKTSTAMKTTAKSATSSVGPMLAMGAAFLLIGAGIGLAAYGVSLLAAAFKDLGEAAPWAAVGIGLFMGAFVIMMGILYALVAGPQAALAAGAVGLLLAVGGAAALIGVGMFLAAYGISLMVDSLVSLSKALKNLSTDQLEKAKDLFESMGGATAVFEIAPGSSAFERTITAVAQLDDSKIENTRELLEMAREYNISAQQSALTVSATNMDPTNNLLSKMLDTLTAGALNPAGALASSISINLDGKELAAGLSRPLNKQNNKKLRKQ